MATTVHDIAKELNLSAMTVSRVLNGSNSRAVASKTRDLVIAKAAQMGYRPNRNARILVTGRTNTVCLFIDHLKSSIYSQLAHECRLAAQNTGMQLVFCETNWHFSRPENYRRYEWAVDGVLAVDPPREATLNRLLADESLQSIPRVNLGSGLGVDWEGDYVRVDLQEGSRAAIRHLASQGCRRIAYCLPDFFVTTEYSHRVFTEVMQQLGLTPEFIPVDLLTLDGARRSIRAYVQAHGAPEGIFCHNDELAIGTYRGLRDLGVRVPEDTLIIGCEGNEFMDYFDPPLSTIAMPVAALAQCAWSMLKRRMDEPDAPARTVLLPFEFLNRQSSNRPTV
jgi:LacI family transcriptional regulator